MSVPGCRSSSGTRSAARLALALALSLRAAPARAATAVQGDRIPNVASVGAAGSAAITSAPAVVTVRISTPATIELLRYAPSAPGATPEPVATGAYRAGPGAGDPVVALAPPALSGAGSALPVPGSLPLLAIATFHQGDPLFVRVTDRDQNMDRTAREAVWVTLVDDLTGDSEIVRLTEDGPDTGVFVGYVPTARAQPGGGQPYDGVLQVLERSAATGRYVDAAEPGDAVQASGLFDPPSKVFDSGTGQPLSGASLTVVDATTGLPATVLSDDGATSFPSTVVSGRSTTDGAGRVFAAGPGEFRFPFLRPGTYRYDIRPPPGYAAPSRATDAALQGLPGAPYAIATGSRGEAFTLSSGPDVHIDVPLDPSSHALWVQKTAGRDRVGVGDLLPYRITVRNLDQSSAAQAVVAVDSLPVGFRYQRGSARLDGASHPDPAVSPDGRTLTFALGDLAPSATATLAVTVQVGAGAAVGRTAVNRASATSAGGGLSNVAEAPVTVVDELFRTRAFVMGRVTVGDCVPRDGVGVEGLRGVRVFMEDGTFEVSDERGLFHFEGLRPGRHVVQLDLASLPEGFEPVSCTSNTRFAGRALSQLVDVQGDTLWRVDFHVRGPPPRPAPAPPPAPAPAASAARAVALTLSHRLSGPLSVEFEADLRGAGAPTKDARLAVTLPARLRYEPGSSTIDGRPVADPARDGERLIYPLGDLAEGIRHRVTFAARAEAAAAPGDAPARAVVLGTEGDGTVAAENLLSVVKEEHLTPSRFVVRPHFPTFGAELTEHDRTELAGIARRLEHSRPQRIVVVGHTDSFPIRARSRRIYPDNVALSLARARAVRAFLLSALRLRENQIEAVGKGPAEPIADNARAAGRALNRRVEVQVEAVEVETRTTLSSVRDRSAAPAAGAGAAVAHPEPALVSTTAPAAPPAPVAAARDGFLSPLDGELIAARIQAVQVRLASYLTPALSVDGKPVDRGRVGYRREDHVTGKTVYTYVGVDLGAEGTHALTLTGADPFGNVRVRETVTVARTGEIASIRFVSADGSVADGRTPVRARVELLDAAGDPIHGVARLELREGDLAPPPLPQGVTPEPGASGPRTVTIDKDGWIVFGPVSASGSHRALLGLGRATVEVETWARPELRDWILVGLAEGTAGYQVVSGNMESLRAADQAEDLYADERLAFYAKGTVQGKWLLTAAYDSARSRASVGDRLFQGIDPQAYFTLYGDATRQGYDASSVRKLYVKIERDQFYALFGDYDTGLTVTELSRYSRRLNGLKAELRTRAVEATGFAAAGDRAFGRDEIPGDGTSGLYHLSRRPITANSETVAIVTRDRFRSEVVRASRTLTRFVDYSIDYDAGTIFFREPVNSRDFQLDPISIVVEYEYQALGRDDYTFGGRAGATALDRRVRAGVTAVHEGEGARRADLAGGDVKVQLDGHTTARAEVAVTEVHRPGSSAVADAYLAEVAHGTRAVGAKLYLREIDSAFGLGQQPLSEVGTRKLGGEAAYRFGERLSLAGEGFRQATFATGAERTFAQTRLAYASPGGGAYLGVLDASDTLLDGSRHESGQAIAGATLLTANERLRVGADYAQSAWEAGRGSADYPTRVTLRGEYRLTPAVAVVAAEEVTWRSPAATENTRVGLRATPWSGGDLTSSVERSVTENALRVVGNVGLRQSWQATDRWKLDAGAERSETLRQAASYQPNPHVPPASGNVSREDFTAISTGANYHARGVVWDSRAEARDSSSARRWSLLSGVVAERVGGWAWTARGQLLGASAGGTHGLGSDLRLGAVHRPPYTRWILLDRLDWIVEHGMAPFAPGVPASGDASPSESWRIVNNALANWRPRKELQLSVGYGAKFARERFDGLLSQGFTDQASVELRYDLTPVWDAGIRWSTLHAWRSGTVSYSAGPSVGYSPATNLWLGVGFNVAGYRDRDFAASGYTAFGPYLRVRVKFDQASVHDAAAWLNGT